MLPNAQLAPQRETMRDNCLSYKNVMVHLASSLPKKPHTQNKKPWNKAKLPEQGQSDDKSQLSD